MNNIHKIWLWVWGCCFTLFASLQFNDPDPEIWATGYFIAAAISILHTLFKIPTWFFLLYAAVNLVWAYFQWPPQFEGFEQSEVHNLNIERARETGGLVLVAIFAVYCASFPNKKVG